MKIKKSIKGGGEFDTITPHWRCNNNVHYDVWHLKREGRMWLWEYYGQKVHN